MSEKEIMMVNMDDVEAMMQVAMKARVRREALYCNITKREFYAAAAMQGFLIYPHDHKTHEDICRESVELADALIKELDKPDKKRLADAVNAYLGMSARPMGESEKKQ